MKHLVYVFALALTLLFAACGDEQFHCRVILGAQRRGSIQSLVFGQVK